MYLHSCVYNSVPTLTVSGPAGFEGCQPVVEPARPELHGHHRPVRLVLLQGLQLRYRVLLEVGRLEDCGGTMGRLSSVKR